MNILVAPDSFKNSLSATEVANSIAEGLSFVLQQGDINQLPLADGGEGTVDALVQSTGGRKKYVMVHDPFMRDIEAPLGLLGSGETAVIEMASASGLERLSDEEKDPYRATSYGTGELIKAVLDQGCKELILGIGGSATVDGGTGLMAALGLKFLGQDGTEFIPTGGNIREITTLDDSSLDKRLKTLRIRIACDVNNPLTGSNGAAFVYGPQKGVKSPELSFFDDNLTHLAQLLEAHSGWNLKDYPGMGAAGGLPAALTAFSEASLEKGFELIAELVKLEDYIRKADLVITGEGKLDNQTRFGKTPQGVARLCQKYNKILIGVGGTITQDADLLYEEGFHLLFPVVDRPMSLQESLTNASYLLTKTGERIGRMLLLSRRVP